MSSKSIALFEPYRLGNTELKNRVVMAPLTRNRADHETDAPRGMNVDYYRQRAGAGLIVTEATQISRQGQGYIYTPGIYTQAQVAGWRKVVDAVHEAGGRIVLQAWHVGRISHTSLQPDGGKPVAPSAIRAETKTYIESGMVDVSEPRALETDEIPGIVDDYRRAFRNVDAAGFDGVEIHAANGYLLDQFMKDGSNTRSDQYGGSIENRCRLTLEVVDAALDILGAGRVGIRLSPAPVQSAEDSQPQQTFLYLVEQLSRRGLAYLHMIEGVTQVTREAEGLDYAALRKAFSGPYLANNFYDRAMAIEAIEQGRADLVAFGRPFISNPDLVERLRRDAPLAPDDRATWYGGDEKGYTDYPTLDQARAAE